MVGLGFVGLRMLGQGSLSLVSRYIINQWWVRRSRDGDGFRRNIFMALLGGGAFP